MAMQVNGEMSESMLNFKSGDISTYVLNAAVNKAIEKKFGKGVDINFDKVLINEGEERIKVKLSFTVSGMKLNDLVKGII